MQARFIFDIVDLIDYNKDRLFEPMQFFGDVFIMRRYAGSVIDYK